MTGAKHTAIHPDKTAFRAVDACGGTYSPDQEASGYAQGHRHALDAACEAAEPVDALMADLLEALSSLLAFTGQMTPRQFIGALYSIDTPGLELCDRDDLTAKLEAATGSAWTAIAKATGADT